MKKGELFKDWKFHILDAKLSKLKLENFKEQIIAQGGKVIDDDHKFHEVDIFITALKSPARISRYVPEYMPKPVVSLEWLEECLDSKTRLPFDGYLVYGTQKNIKENKVGELEKIRRPDISQITNFNLEENSSVESDGSDSLSSYGGDQEDHTEDEDVDLDPTFNNTRYECLRPTPLIPKYNQSLIELLEIIAKARDLEGEHRNALSYCIGSKIGYQTKLYLETGTIEEAEDLRNSEKFTILETFSHVYGVGPKTAQLWYKKGYRTLEDACKDPYLTEAQRIGLELFEQFQKKISRKEVEEIIEILEKEIKAVDPRCILTPVGGYRRGKEFSGDVDVIVTHPVEEAVTKLLPRIIDQLSQKGYLKYKMWYGHTVQKVPKLPKVPKRNLMDRLDKCFCAFYQPSAKLHRQVDIIIAPRSLYPTAIVGWTGSRQFERSLKHYARKEKNLVFASHGLFTNTMPRRRIPLSTEREVFDAIGVPWLEPEMRNC
ncbi:4208_t:CDS:10 [Ambispora leptoticha]|uniref:DNA polymerase n=1 Tax=Ambispora leptoticha TaxID=144679 RepID=A0A9N8Z210_9GLOM|nr:4208_t:CDS:10 [Ambispora leptoticha]